jgi:hypothetical protein
MLGFGGYNTCVTYYKVHNILELLKKIHIIQTVKLVDPTAAVGLAFHVEY